MKSFAIFGVGGCGRGVMPLARQQFKNELFEKKAELVFVDDKPKTLVLNGHKVLTYLEWLKQPINKKYICVAIANSLIRSQIVQRCLNDGIDFFEVRAANVLQMDNVILGEGAILSPFVTLTSNINIGKHFHANLYSYVEHDCMIGNFVTFGPGVKCNGNIKIEDHAYIGSGAIIKNGQLNSPIVIGRGAIVGMGAVVTKSIAPGVKVIGNPARDIVKESIC